MQQILRHVKKWLGGRSKNGGGRARRAPSVRPALEQLERREVPAVLGVSFHGGPVLAHVEVDTVFLGQAWSTTPGLPQEAGAINQYLSYLSGSSYMTMLEQYGVDGGYRTGSTTAPFTLGGVIDDSGIRAALNYEILHGGVQAPDANRLYVVYTPPGVRVTRDGGINGVNFGGYHDFFVDSLHQVVAYAVLPNPVGNDVLPGLSAFSSLTVITSHELAEAATDPTYSGWYNNTLGLSGEIGDLVEPSHGTLGGYAVQREWSNVDGRGILPVARIDVAADFTARSTQEYYMGIFAGRPASYAGPTSEGGLIGRYYEQLLGRASVTAGELQYWYGRMISANWSDEQLQATMMSAAPIADNTPWLTAVYRGMLGRAPDAGGLQFWESALPKLGRYQVALDFAESQEGEGYEAVLDYDRYLGRAASPTERAYWATLLVQDKITREQMVDDFLASNEYFIKHDSTNEGWLTGLYNNLLDRQPDPGGYAFWLNYLRAGGG